MASLVLSVDGEVLKEYPINKPLISIGRRPGHDIAINNLAVSGSHALITRQGDQLILEDNGSTNGTKVNGQATEKWILRDGDVIEIGKYHLRYFAAENAVAEPFLLDKTLLMQSPFAGKQLDLDDASALDTPTAMENFATTISPTMSARPGASRSPETAQAGSAPHALHYALRVLNGKQAGKEIPLTKPLTTIGKKDVQVAVITRHEKGYFLNHVQGRYPIINGVAINDKACPISENDVIEFSGVKMRVEKIFENSNSGIS